MPHMYPCFLVAPMTWLMNLWSRLQAWILLPMTILEARIEKKVLAKLQASQSSKTTRTTTTQTSSPATSATAAQPPPQSETPADDNDEKKKEPQPEVIHLCPLCDQEMVTRRASRGGVFWGCPKYPKCRGTRSWRDPSKASPIAEVKARHSEGSRNSTQANRHK